MSSTSSRSLSVEQRAAALTIEQCRAIVINMAHRLDVLDVVIGKMLRDAMISFQQLRPGCELLARIMAAKQSRFQGVPAPELDKNLVVLRTLVDLTDESTMEQPPQPVIDLTGDLTIDLTADEPFDLPESQIQDLEGLAGCLSDKHFRDLVIELAHDPATAVLAKYRLWAASLGWMAPSSRGIAVAPYMIARNTLFKSVSCGSGRQQKRQPQPITVTPRKKPSHVSTAVKSGRVHKAGPVRPAIARPRNHNGDQSGSTGDIKNPAENKKP